jgi:hypothetical protein
LSLAILFILVVQDIDMYIPAKRATQGRIQDLFVVSCVQDIDMYIPACMFVST